MYREAGQRQRVGQTTIFLQRKVANASLPKPYLICN
jgi:hypothetical protein